MKKYYKLYLVIVVFAFNLGFVKNAIATTPDVVANFFQTTGHSVTYLGGTDCGDWYSDWFGEFHVYLQNGMGINHTLHGFLVVSAGSGDEIKFTDNVLNCTWKTTPDDYPTVTFDGIVTPDESGQLIFQEDTSQPNREWEDSDGVLWTEDGSHIPPYYQNPWNAAWGSNNCYNYACNRFGNSIKSDPGDGSGHDLSVDFPDDDYTLEEIREYIVDDGLIPSSQFEQNAPSNRAKVGLMFCPKGYYFLLPDAPVFTTGGLACLELWLDFWIRREIPFSYEFEELWELYDCDNFVYDEGLWVPAPTSSYHFLRQDPDGGWSHKVGWQNYPYCQARDWDDNNNDITNPQNAYIKNGWGQYFGCTDQEYPVWGGYFYCITDPEQGQSTADIIN